jgi:hypothetical protein
MVKDQNPKGQGPEVLTHNQARTRPGSRGPEPEKVKKEVEDGSGSTRGIQVGKIGVGKGSLSE